MKPAKAAFLSPLLPETLHPRAVVGWALGQEFQGDKSVEAGVLGFVHHTHSTATQLLDDAVVGDGPADERVGVRQSAAMLDFRRGASQRSELFEVVRRWYRREYGGHRHPRLVFYF